MIAFPNRTRTSRSIPLRLLREGKVHLLPLYALMRTSDLGREGIENSGSYRFADHIYRNEPSGRYVVGWLVDALLLRLRGARSMRNRFLHSQREIIRAAQGRAASDVPFRVLSVPCGIARDLAQASLALRERYAGLHAQTTFFGLDLDPEPLEYSRRLVGNSVQAYFIQGDALDAGAYPVGLDVVVSTGFGEFLTDELLVQFYRLCYGALREGGVLVTSCMQRDPVADYLMRELAELRAHYRRGQELHRLFAAAGFVESSIRQDDAGLQSLIVARKRLASTA